MNNILEELITTGERFAGDNAVITNCSNEFLHLAHRELVNNDECRSCRVVFNEKNNEMINELFSNYNDMNKKIFARTYVITFIINSMSQAYPEIENFGLGFDTKDLEFGLTAFENKDYLALKNYYLKAPWANDIATIVSRFGKMELNVFMTCKLNKYIQQEINNQIGSRLPYCVKIFTNQSTLSSYTTTNGEFIQSPHDYISYDFSNLENKTL